MMVAIRSGTNSIAQPQLISKINVESVILGQKKISHLLVSLQLFSVLLSNICRLSSKVSPLNHMKNLKSFSLM